MINSLKQHEKTFQKFVEWIDKGNYFVNKDELLKRTFLGDKPIGYRLTNDRELLSLLVEFCREQNYWINIIPISEFGQGEYLTFLMLSIEKFINEENPIRNEYYYEEPDLNKYTETMIIGIKKCFELMEKNNG